MKVYIITQHEKQDSIGFPQYWEPECYSSKEKAESRFSSLKENLKDYSGFYYSMEEVVVID